MKKIILFGLLFLFPQLISSAIAESELDNTEANLNLREEVEISKAKVLLGTPKFTLVGKVDRGIDSEFAINGEDFLIDADTRVSGESLKLYSFANVRGERIGNRNYAKKILVSTPSSTSTIAPKSIGEGDMDKGPTLKGPNGEKIPK